jgi:phospholipase C
VISPFGVAHGVSHVYSEHSSVIRFIDEVFGLTPLADLPDEKGARGLHVLKAPDGSVQTDLGPADDFVEMGDLLEAFDNDRLLGKAALLAPGYAEIAGVNSLPHAGGAGCKALGITPTDYPHGVVAGGESDPPPGDFNPRPVVTPGVPMTGGWVP